MKVKKFRVKSRLPSVGRILKSLLSVTKLPPEIETSLPKEAEAFLKTVMPMATYTSFSGAEIPASFLGIAKEKGVQGAVALTAYAVTVGPGPDETLSSLLLKGETTRAQLITALGEDLADAALQFLVRLLAEDAENDECELSELMSITDPALLRELLAAAHAGQEGILMDSANHLTPRFTRVGLVGWIPVNKKRRAALLKDSSLKSQKPA